MSGSRSFVGASSNLNPNFLMSQFVPTVTVPDGTSTANMLDVFSPNMKKAIDSVVRVGLARYQNQPVPTIGFKYFNNTTCWWMIMLASKQMHALTIEPGDEIVLPSIDTVAKSLTVKIPSGARIPVFVKI